MSFLHEIIIDAKTLEITFEEDLSLRYSIRQEGGTIHLAIQRDRMTRNVDNERQ